MSKVLYLDCFSGASGDMMLGALLDLGLPLEALREALGSLALDGVTIDADRVDRAGVAATKFRVLGAGDQGHGDDHDHEHGETHQHDHSHEHTHGHSHDHAVDHAHSHGHEHHHRGLSEICAMVDRSALSASAKERATGLFRRLAETEAAIHQQPVDTIHLHEVGAVDSIIDIAGAVVGLEWLGAERIVSSPLNVGSGTVKCAHGLFPVPAPATTRLLADAPIYSSGVQAELLTPTGALLVTDYADAYGPMPALRVRQVGYGAGDRNLPDRPNVLRIVVGDEEARAGETERMLLVECEIDDMNPQIYGTLMDKLYAVGALDVFYAPIQMKKNRPGTLVSVVARPDQREAVTEVVFRETTTIGVRVTETDRLRLAREQITVETPLGPVHFKVARRGDAVVNASPEFEDCVRLADEHGQSVKSVQALATKCYLDQAEGSK